MTMAARRARTAREAALQRMLAGKTRHRPPKVLPRQAHPKVLEAEYAKDIVGVVDKARAAFAPLIAELPTLIRSAAQDRARLDALREDHVERRGSKWVVLNEDRTKVLATEDSREEALKRLGEIEWFKAHPDHRQDGGESARVRQLIQNATERMKVAIQPTAIEDLARKFAEKIKTNQRLQLGRQVQAALGADVVRDRPKLQDQIDNFVQHNVSLITTIPEKLKSDVENMVQHAVTSGTLGEDLGDQIQELTDDIDDRFAMSERHARFIARDQAGKLYGDINESRQRTLGVSKFTWRSSEDERVRGNPDGKYPNAMPSHFDLDGQTFEWDDPPQPEGADEPLTPGKDYGCRCTGEPVLDEILDDEDQGEDQGDDTETTDDTDTEE